VRNARALRALGRAGKAREYNRPTLSRHEPPSRRLHRLALDAPVPRHRPCSRRRRLGGVRRWRHLRRFNVAFRIPNLLRRLFGEGAFSQAFVPTLARLRAAEGDAETQRLIDAVATVLAGALVVTCVLGIAPRRWSSG
jgi:hypothetical protein